MDLEPIACRSYGTIGPTVVVLHGGPGAPGSAASLCQLIARWARVIEPLQRRAGEVPLTVDQHVRDLAQVAPPRAAVVGHSWGAMLGLSYAAAHPKRVSRLVLVACGTYDEDTRREYRRRMDACLGAAGLQRKRDLYTALDRATDGRQRDRLLAQLGKVSQQAQSVDPLPDDPDCGPELDVDEQGHAQTWADVLARQRNGIDPASFTTITCPVTMLHGADDPHPGRATAELLRRHIAAVEYLEFARCGHDPWRERAAHDDFDQALRATIG